MNLELRTRFLTTALSCAPPAKEIAKSATKQVNVFIGTTARGNLHPGLIANKDEEETELTSAMSYKRVQNATDTTIDKPNINAQKGRFPEYLRQGFLYADKQGGL